MEVRSPHYRVLTNGRPSDARHVAHEFEQMRYVFAHLNPGFRVDSGPPMLIFAVRDEYTARSLEPTVWKRKGVKPLGTFGHGWEKQYVMVRLDATGVNVHSVVYHEYTHSILHMNVLWLPTWLDEGMAEFYGYTRFRKNKIYIGAPTGRPLHLRRTPVPVKTMIAVTPNSPYYHDADKVGVFYAEAWAMVHYLTFGPGMDHGARLTQYFRLIQQGTPQSIAFPQVFGSFAEVDKKLDHYMNGFTFAAIVLKDPPQIEEKAFAAHKLSLAQTEAELAGFHLWTRDLTDARPLVKKSLKEDPCLGLAHEENGFLLFADGKNRQAAGEFRMAYTLDNSLYLSRFAKTMLSPMAESNASADESAFHQALEGLATMNPQYAPVYVQVARLSVRQNDPKRAFGYSRRAEELDPWRAGYHLLSGEILLRLGKDAEAAEDARYVADHWYGPDRDEAIELWNRIPAAQRPAGESIAAAPLKSTQSVTGTVQSVTCPAPGQPWTLVLNHDGKPMTFHAKGYFEFGFSDTFWWGQDHFNTCRHYEGKRAVIKYRPQANAKSTENYAGDVVQIGVRDDLPATPIAAAGETPPAGKR